MEFGKLSDISRVDFTLPHDHPKNCVTLKSKAVPGADFSFYFGSSRWGEKDLIGKIYPPRTAARDYLHYYTRQFSSIEMNTTYYRIPSPDTVKKWCRKAHPDFLFCPKLPQSISHSPDFGYQQEATRQFTEALYAFDKQLGMSFMQLPPEFSPRQGRALFDYLQAWPKDLPLAVEFRHPDWFGQERIRQRAFELLEELGISAVITDTAGRRDVLQQRLTTTQAFIRFVGNHLHPTDYLRIDAWVDRIQSWKEMGISHVFFMLHQHEEQYCVDLAIYLVERINSVCKLNLSAPRPLPLGEQQRLF